ncbi:glycerophosphodiester phosphodiesterase family protein [Tenacibaculum sp. UWU-22]|uniref:glycerophosphodiester phosphodiesterase family protein n=1 Tax=Tenacibaculum sp. UWU-22 TaxID=3234187 RepID=UPI0034DB4401
MKKQLSWLLLLFIAVMTTQCKRNKSNTEIYSVAKAKKNVVFTPQSVLRYSKNLPPLVSSHRGGATKFFPENCLETFQNTLKHTFSLLEIDPHYTKDSVIVLMHDASLNRTTTGSGKVLEHTYKEITQYKLKDLEGNVTEFKVPKLADIINWAKGKTFLILDMKDVPTEQRVKEIQRNKGQSSTILMVYNYKDAKLCYDLDPTIMMEVFIPTLEKAKEFEKTGVPWKNVIAFITHQKPEDDSVINYLHTKDVLCIVGSSRTVDVQYTKDNDIDKLNQGYESILQTGADIIEANLGILAGKYMNQRNKKEYQEFINSLKNK